MRYKHLEKKWYETYDSLTNIEEDEKEKLRDCGYEIEWLYNQEEKCIVGLDGRMIFKVNGARLRKKKKKKIRRKGKWKRVTKIIH